MKLCGGEPYWAVRNGLLATYPPLEDNIHCDVAVVGAGITGALVAYHFAQAGIDTVVLDKREVGSGSTCGSTGLLQYEVDKPLRELIPQVGARKANRSYLACLHAIQKIRDLVKKNKMKCELGARPSLFLARKADELPALEDECRLRQDLGINVTFWDRRMIEKHFPFSRPGALFSEEAAEIDPHRFTQGLLTNAEEKGLRIFDRTRVVLFIPDRHGIKLVTEKGFEIRAKRVVVAAGFESQNYISSRFGQLKSTFALITEPVASLHAWHRRCLIWETGSPYLYLRTAGENRIIVGGEDVDLVAPNRRDALLAAKTTILHRKAVELFPDIRMETAFSWAGTFSSTKDGLAYIGTHRTLPHAYFALGYGGNGITYSLIAAEIIRDNFLGKHNPNAAIFSFER